MACLSKHVKSTAIKAEDCLNRQLAVSSAGCCALLTSDCIKRDMRPEFGATFSAKGGKRFGSLEKNIILATLTTKVEILVIMILAGGSLLAVISVAAWKFKN